MNLKHGAWPRPLFWISLSVLLALDQVSKGWFIRHYQPGSSVPVIPGFFSLTYVRNDGMAFGLFQGNNLLLGLLACLILILGLYYSRFLNWRLLEPNILGALFLAGAAGNLIDRFRHGYVVDFADFYLGNWHWPAFNVADSCITVMVVWLFVRMTIPGGTRVDHGRQGA